MTRFLLAPLALGALFLSSVAASAAPRPPHHQPVRKQAYPPARPQPAPRPTYHYHRGEPLPTHRVTRLPLRPAPTSQHHR